MISNVLSLGEHQQDKLKYGEGEQFEESSYEVIVL